MSHFRAIHRGSFFQEMRTTDARQLLPDGWGIFNLLIIINFFVSKKFCWNLNSFQKIFVGVDA
jgi:RNA polymerase Rpb2, domain 3